MAFFTQKTEDETKKVAPKKAASKKVAPKKVALPVSSKNSAYADILLRPMVTEKVHAISTSGQYAFFTNYDVNKFEIKKAVEQIYGVHVKSVSTSRVKPKKRVRGKDVGYTRRLKKAIVSLRKGETIALFEGV